MRQEMFPKLVLPPREYDIDDTDIGESFKGFDQKHVLVTGTTGSGKTTLLLLLINKLMFEIPEKIYWVDSNHTEKNFRTFQQSVCAAVAKRTESINNLPQIFFVRKENISKLIDNELKESVRKLVVFEDTTSYDPKDQTKVWQYVSVAKNSNAQVIFMKHLSTREKVYYQYFGYIILCRPTFRDYNSTINNINSDKPVFEIEKALSGLPEKFRSLIHVVETKKNYFAYGKLGEITAAHEIKKNERTENKRNEQQSNAKGANELLGKLFSGNIKIT